MMFYLYFLAFSALEILLESWISTKNSKALIQKGAVEITPFLLTVMTILYAILYVGSLGEYLFFKPEVSTIWLITFLLLFCLAKTVKFWAIRSLGPFWTMRVLILPESNVVTSGPYKWIRHPNYVAVLMEIVAIPALGQSFLTLAFVLTLFSVTLVFRIRYEEEALMQHTDYSSMMKTRGRFLP